RSVGIQTRGIQYLALLCSGLLAGFGGAYMSMGYVSWFAANMTSGRGFIGLAAAAMGPTPWGTMSSSLFFGFADALSNAAQSLRMPSEFVRMIPYISTIIAITIYSSKMKKSTAASPGE
ncbi:MAG: ABC transporter permease, partial [Spirochaetota bacterium]